MLKPNPLPFLGPPEEFSDLKTARAVVVPFPYEGGVSYGLGTAAAPQAVLEASRQVEFYDEMLDCEPYYAGIGTLETPQVPQEPEQMACLISDLTDELLGQGKFPVVIGGDHSITSGIVRAIARHHRDFGVIQLDAHADLRDSYEDSKLSHACTMARILEITPHILQIGIRSMAAEEALRVRREKLQLVTMRQWREGSFDFDVALAALPDNIFLTLDVDVLDWSVVASTGTPEPGGMLWDEALQLLHTLFRRKNVIGCDVVELSFRKSDPNSPYAVAKLIYKMIGFKFESQLVKC